MEYWNSPTEPLTNEFNPSNLESLRPTYLQALGIKLSPIALNSRFKTGEMWSEYCPEIQGSSYNTNMQALSISWFRLHFIMPTLFSAYTIYYLLRDAI